MIKFLILLVTILSIETSLFATGQMPEGEVSGYFTEPVRPEKEQQGTTQEKERSGHIRIYDYTKNTSSQLPPLYYVNEKPVNLCLPSVDSSQIEDIRIKPDTVVMDDRKYYGEVHIWLKEDYVPAFLSLNALKEKYIEAPLNLPVLFLVDGEPVEADYDTCMVDENYLLSVTLTPVKVDKEYIDMYFISILTRSRENIKKASEMWAR